MSNEKVGIKAIVDIKKKEIRIPFNPDSTEESASRKSFILASSRGFQTEGDISISFNVIKKK